MKTTRTLGRWSAAAAAVALGMTAGAAAGCHRSGMGETCNGDADCQKGLLCDPQTRTCLPPPGGTDASPGTDATPGSDAVPNTTDAVPGGDSSLPSDGAMSGTDSAPPPGTDSGPMCVPAGYACMPDPSATPCCAGTTCCCAAACGPGVTNTCLAVCPVG